MSFPTHNRLAAVQVLFRHLGVRQVARSTIIWLVLIAMSLAVTACGDKFTPTLTPEPTRLTSFVLGELVAVDSCLRVSDRDSGTSYLLAWPPDFAVSIERDTVQIATGNGKKVVLHIGEMVRISGGEVKSIGYLDERVQQRLPVNCPGPYWVVGDEISSVEATEESK